MEKPVRVAPLKVTWGIRERAKAVRSTSRLATRLRLTFGRIAQPSDVKSSSSESTESMQGAREKTQSAPNEQRAVGLEHPPTTTSSGTGMERIKLLSLLCPSCKHLNLYNVKQPR